MPYPYTAYPGGAMPPPASMPVTPVGGTAFSPQTAPCPPGRICLYPAGGGAVQPIMGLVAPGAAATAPPLALPVTPRPTGFQLPPGYQFHPGALPAYPGNPPVGALGSNNPQCCPCPQ